MKIARTPIALAAAGALILGSPSVAMADTEEEIEVTDVVDGAGLGNSSSHNADETAAREIEAEEPPTIDGTVTSEAGTPVPQSTPGPLLVAEEEVLLEPDPVVTDETSTSVQNVPGIDDGSILHTFDYADRTDEPSEDLPVDVEVDFYEPERSLQNANQVLVYRHPGIDFSWNEEATSTFNGFEDVVAIPVGGALTITATARPGYSLPEETGTQWSFEHLPGVPEDEIDTRTLVWPETPVLDGNMVTIPDVEGVDYGYAPGTVEIPEGGMIVVDANPMDGYKFPEDIEESYWIFQRLTNGDDATPGDGEEDHEGGGSEPVIETPLESPRLVDGVLTIPDNPGIAYFEPGYPDGAETPVWVRSFEPGEEINLALGENIRIGYEARPGYRVIQSNYGSGPWWLFIHHGEIEEPIRQGNMVTIPSVPGLEYSAYVLHGGGGLLGGNGDVVEIPRDGRLAVSIAEYRAAPDFIPNSSSIKEWLFDYEEDTDGEAEESTVVSPSAPTRTDNVLTIPDTAGVDYGYAPGTVVEISQGGLTIEATPLDGFSFPVGTAVRWNFDFISTAEDEPSLGDGESDDNGDGQPDLGDEEDSHGPGDAGSGDGEDPSVGDDANGGEDGDGGDSSEGADGTGDPDTNTGTDTGTGTGTDTDSNAGQGDQTGSGGDSGTGGTGSNDGSVQDPPASTGDAAEPSTGIEDATGNDGGSPELDGAEASTPTETGSAASDGAAISSAGENSSGTTDAAIADSGPDSPAGDDTEVSEISSGTTAGQDSETRGSGDQDPAALAQTGSSAGWAALGSAALILLGLAVVLPTRRRRPAQN